MRLPCWLVCIHPVSDFVWSPSVPGRYLEGCSDYLLISEARGNTSELQSQVGLADSAPRARFIRACVQADIAFLLAEAPQHEVVCHVRVSPEKLAFAATPQLTLAPQQGLASLNITGQPDWEAAGDIAYSVLIGPCRSLDQRFNGIGFPEMPAVTAVRVVNTDVSMPVVDAVVPSSIHTSGRSITVYGTNFGPESRLFFCGSVLGQPHAQRGSSEWTWVYNNATGSRHPIQRVALDGLPKATVIGGLVTIDDKGHNITLCDVMRQKGYELSNCTMEESDFRKVADADLSELLQFKYVNRSIITVTTPCLSQVCLMCTSAFRARLRALRLCL